MELPNQEVSQGINMVNACLELQVVFCSFFSLISFPSISLAFLSSLTV